MPSSDPGPRLAVSLADARNPLTQRDLNLKIKFRESFRPFAPCVLRGHVHEWFAMRRGEDSPYMLMGAPLLDEHRVPLSSDERETMAATPTCRDGSESSAALSRPSRTSTTAAVSRPSTTGMAGSTAYCERFMRTLAVPFSLTPASTSPGNRSS